MYLSSGPACLCRVARPGSVHGIPRAVQRGPPGQLRQAERAAQSPTRKWPSSPGSETSLSSLLLQAGCLRGDVRQGTPAAWLEVVMVLVRNHTHCVRICTHRGPQESVRTLEGEALL